MAAQGDLYDRVETRIFGNSDELGADLAEYVAQLSENFVRERGVFTIALTGGSLINLLGNLCKAPYDKIVDWTKWYVFWADERAVAKNHVDSNYKLAKDGFLSKVPVLSSHIYSINDNLTAEDAATEYGFGIRQLVKVRTVNVSEHNDCPKFDLILLHMGSDGHIASLFPDHSVLDQKADWVTYITDAPMSPPERITFTLPVINSASNVAIVAMGEEKANAVHQAIADTETDGSLLPAKMVRPADGKLVWFLDSFAASKLEVIDNGNYRLYE